jgi:hypothetical protein
MNYRGQNYEAINKNYLINIKYEDLFKNHIKKILNVELIKTIDRYSHYDFKYNNSIIEYKGLYYTLDNINKIGYSKEAKKNPIYCVIIGEDKIKHYKIMKNKNKDLKIYLFYGFYDLDTDKGTIKEIIYKYLDITELLNEILTEYNKFEYNSKMHFQIPIKLLEDVNENLLMS